MGIIIRNMNATTGITNIRIGKGVPDIDRIEYNNFRLISGATFNPETHVGRVANNTSSVIQFMTPLQSAYVEIEHQDRGVLSYGFIAVGDTLLLGNLSYDNRYFTLDGTINVPNTQISANMVSSYILLNGELHFFIDGVHIYSSTAPINPSGYLFTCRSWSSLRTSNFTFNKQERYYTTCMSQIK